MSCNLCLPELQNQDTEWVCRQEVNFKEVVCKKPYHQGLCWLCQKGKDKGLETLAKIFCPLILSLQCLVDMYYDAYQHKCHTVYH